MTARKAQSRLSNLERLRRGQMTLAEYLDKTVEEVLADFKHRIPASEHAFVRELLRDRVTTSPVIRPYLERAIGRRIR